MDRAAGQWEMWGGTQLQCPQLSHAMQLAVACLGPESCQWGRYHSTLDGDFLSLIIGHNHESLTIKS